MGLHPHQHKVQDNVSVYDEGTLFKVYTALRDADITESTARDAISAMQNAGILFRERPVAAVPSPHPTPRGTHG